MTADRDRGSDTAGRLSVHPGMVTTATATVGRLVAGPLILFGNGYFVTTEFALTRVRQFAESEFQGSRVLVTATDAFAVTAGEPEDPLDDARARGE